MPNEKLCEKFERIFGISLEGYVSISGFDIIKFDENFVKSADGSMADAVREKFGEEAVDTIRELNERTLHSLWN